MKENKNWVKIKDADYYTIIKKYREKIYELGYDLTIDDMADYLRCTYNYVQSHITPKLSYIVINAVARNLLYKAVRDDLLEYSTLYTKRRLYKRSDFEKYIYSHAKVIKKYHRIYMTDLSDDAQKKLEILHEKRPEKSVREWFKVLSKRSHDAAIDAEQVYPLKHLPQLLSLKDIKVALKLNYDVQAYRYIAKIGAPKIKIGSLIRYDQEDLKKAPPLYALPCNCDKQEFLQEVEERISVFASHASSSDLEA